MIELSVIVTIYNAEPVIPDLMRRLHGVATSITENYELIFIEDRGKDQSWKLLKSFAKEDKRVKVARMVRNFGQHNAITAGLNLAGGNYVVMMDGDLQDEPEVIRSIYEEIRAREVEIVYVKRINRKDSRFKVFTSSLFNRLFSTFSGIKSDPQVGTFRIMTSLVRESFCRFQEINKYVGGIFYWMDFDCCYFEAEHAERAHGKSNYNFRRMFKLAVNGMLSFSNKPLNIALYIGIISAAVSMLLGMYFIYNKLVLHTQVTGYSSLIVSLYFIGGLILFVLGIIGQYIGRIYDQTKDRPDYLFQEKINFL